MNEENINVFEEEFADKVAEESINSDPVDAFTEENLEEETEKNTENTETEPEPPFFSMYVQTVEECEKKDVKRLGRVSGISFLVFEGVMVLLSGIIMLLTNLFPLNSMQIYNFLSEPAINQVQQILFSILLFTVPFITVYKLFGYRISDLISFKPPKGKKSLYLFLIGISFCSFANIAANMAGQIFDSAGIEYEVDFGEEPLGFFASFEFNPLKKPSIFLIPLIVPLCFDWKR